MFGPLKGKRHDCALLRLSNLLPKLNQYAFDTNGNALCVYGDPAYPLRVHLQCPIANPTTAQEMASNKSMSQVRISVKWLFGDIANWWAFIDFKKNLKHLTCALLTNARTCLYGNMISQYFNIEPPNLEEYFV